MVHDSAHRGLEAVKVWELGVSKEKDGLMMDAIVCYRRALKMDEAVEKNYRKIVMKGLTKKHSDNVSESDKDRIIDGKPSDDTAGVEAQDETEALQLPCWLLETLPEDVLQHIVHHVIAMSGESWVNLSLTCKKFQQLCFEKPDPYRAFAHRIYPLQHYDEATMTLNGLNNLIALEQALWGSDYKRMLEERAYVKFQGCYISVVNYLRHGANLEGSSSLVSPVHMITYYRYLRFYPDGTCLRLVTTDEPSVVVRHFSRHRRVKDAELCHWTCSIDDDFSILTVKRRNEKYEFVETLQIHSHGRRRYHRLQWIKSEAFQDTGDQIQFSMHEEKPFSFSRVNSYANDVPEGSKERQFQQQSTTVHQRTLP
ncbi:LANO_0C06832g1_1 [Lachancea nothofagi CBS 11611]|uniref:LANO_0C06832g1_1 n=1 Tax=Lachancea nothofagi CBS 11611 TaxID=1266666 RepID=A0A1G4J8Q9_9SACH|nr:LANO_0C06832g1_1 [Lachancea nothofagi CBS 11611]